DVCAHVTPCLPSLLTLPTRRSSDLKDDQDENDRETSASSSSSRPSPAKAASRKYGASPSSAGAAPSWTPSAGAAESGPAGTSSVDRKSTRLNSSHVSISYAVF